MIQPGTPISFLPDWASDAWRAAILVAIIIVMLRMGARAARDAAGAPVLFYGRISLFLMFLADGIANALRWGEPVTWVGAPITTAALVFAWIALRNEPQQ